MANESDTWPTPSRISLRLLPNFDVVFKASVIRCSTYSTVIVVPKIDVLLPFLTPMPFGTAETSVSVIIWKKLVSRLKKVAVQCGLSPGSVRVIGKSQNY